MHTPLRRLSLAVVGLTLVITAGCASVKIRKLNSTGTDVVGPEGMRFYMPRPYVTVFEPFILDSKFYLVAGRLTSDRQFVWVSSVPEELKSRFPGSLKVAGEPVLVPLNQVQIPASGTGRLQADTNVVGTIINGLGTKVLTGTGPESQGAAPATQATEKPGILNLKVSNDNQAFALTPTRRFFDILWLPDFDEYYVVKGKAGFGNASIAMQMGQGWSLQGLEASADNSELVKRAYSLYDKSIELLLKYGTTALGLPPIPIGGLQAETLSDKVAKGEVKAGEEITLKVSLSRLAAPGLYPILKPNELARVEGWSDAKRAEVGKGMLIPTAPLQNVAFKTFEVLVIEAARPVGDSPLNFATYKDLTIPQLQTLPGTGLGQPSGTRLTPEKLKELGQQLKSTLTLSTALVTQDTQGKIHVDARIPKTSAATPEDVKTAITTALPPMLNPLGAELDTNAVRVFREE